MDTCSRTGFSRLCLRLMSAAAFTSFYEMILPYQIVQPHSRRRPAHSLVTGCCGPLQICCGLSVAGASCTYVIALSAHSAATRPWNLHLLLHGAENACRACIGRRLDELMLTCQGQLNALIRDSHLSEHKETFSLISFANISAQLVSTTIIVQHPALQRLSPSQSVVAGFQLCKLETRPQTSIKAQEIQRLSEQH